MIERKSISRGTPLKGHVLGCAQGVKLHIAILNVEGGAVHGCEFLEFRSPHMAMAYLVERPEPLGIGMDATLALGTGSIGWRPADYWLHNAPFHREDRYDEFPFYWGPFQMDGGRSLAAIALLSAMRRRWPDLPATETAPNETYTHLARSKAKSELPERTTALARWLNMGLPALSNRADWQAAMSAYAMWTGLRGAWPIDLHALTRSGGEAQICTFGDGMATEETFQEPSLDERSLIFPAGPAFFFWPPDDRART